MFTSFSLDVIMPLGFMAIGIAVGIVVSANYVHISLKLINWILEV